MNYEALYREVCEIDGWTLEKSNSKDGVCWHQHGIQSEVAPPDYLESLDAIVPVIMTRDLFVQEFVVNHCIQKTGFLNGGIAILLSTPRELCEALVLGMKKRYDRRKT